MEKQSFFTKIFTHIMGKCKKYKFGNKSQQWLEALDKEPLFTLSLLEKSIIWSFKKGVRERMEE